MLDVRTATVPCYRPGTWHPLVCGGLRQRQSLVPLFSTVHLKVVLYISLLPCSEGLELLASWNLYKTLLKLCLFSPILIPAAWDWGSSIISQYSSSGPRSLRCTTVVGPAHTRVNLVWHIIINESCSPKSKWPLITPIFDRQRFSFQVYTLLLNLLQSLLQRDDFTS